MHKHVPVRSSAGHTAGIRTSKERSSVQSLIDQIFVICERLSTAQEPGLNDRIVRAFSTRYDADTSAGSLNERHRKLAEADGRRPQRIM